MFKFLRTVAEALGRAGLKVMTNGVRAGWLFFSLRSKRFRGEKSEKPGCQRFTRAKNGARAKIGRRGVGEGSEGNACGQTP